MIVHTCNSSPLRSNLFRLQCACCTVPTTYGRLHGSPLVWACQWPSSQPHSSPQLSHNDNLWAWGISKSHREQGLDYSEAEELSWCPSWSNSLWQGWSCGLVHCPGANTTDPIWRVLASSDRISSTPLKPQNSNPNPNPLANQLWCIYFLTPPTPLIIPHRLPAFLESLMPLRNWCSIHARWSKSNLEHSIRFCSIFPCLKQNFIAYCFSKVSSCPDCIFEIHSLWQSGFTRVNFNSFCSRSFEPKIIKNGLSSHTIYSNNILHFRAPTSILNACTKKSKNLLKAPRYLHVAVFNQSNQYTSLRLRLNWVWILSYIC